MLFRLHAQVVLGEAALFVRFIKGGVASVQDVHFGVGQSGVVVLIDSTVTAPNEFSPADDVSLSGS